MKKILLHCSVNWNTSNFGDVLFAYMLLKRLTDKGIEASFYDVSDYVDHYLYEVCKLPRYNVTMLDADGVVYFAGGYFGEQKRPPFNRSYFRRHQIHYSRFMSFGEKALRMGKPIGIFGIGAGDYLWRPSEEIVKNVCNKAACITTRDIESTEYLQSIGVNRDIKTCSDVAQTITMEELSPDEKMRFDPQSSYVFLHINTRLKLTKLFSKGIRSLVKNNDNIKVIIGSDGCGDNAEATALAGKILGVDKVINYTYTTPDNLCFVLSKCDLVLTYKLHVGIITCTLGKSVIAISKHEKVKRYYKQIGESGRQIDYKNANTSQISDLAFKYYKKDVVLNDDIKALASENWNMLDNYIDSL